MKCGMKPTRPISNSARPAISKDVRHADCYSLTAKKMAADMGQFTSALWERQAMSNVLFQSFFLPDPRRCEGCRAKRRCKGMTRFLVWASVRPGRRLRNLLPVLSTSPNDHHSSRSASGDSNRS